MLISLTEAKDYLGESGTDNDKTITNLIKGAEEELTRATGISWSTALSNSVAKNVCQMMVWRDFFAARDAAKNTGFLQARITGLITQLQYGSEQDETL
jgi:hypothetical protein